MKTRAAARRNKPGLRQNPHMSVIKMVVGLGNPGDEYVDTRHNLGFRVIDSLAGRLGADVKQRKFGARFGAGELSDKKLILLKPWQYMNRSGQAVATAAGFYRLSLSDLLVVTDDLSLAPGRIRIRAQGSSGGHNGLADIVEKLGTHEFGRLRIGIGDNGRIDSAVYVLKRPRVKERALLDEAIGRATDAVFWWIEHGIEATMNKFNGEQPDSE
ncbi:MAG: aminoacyl-tRNA hydrolase [Sedimentisphaerales bacterium]|nr:aminoacyl-tRNA hydrolase [Sedimentisphaerales bacterium]